jgi:hypothetical protein
MYFLTFFQYFPDLSHNNHHLLFDVPEPLSILWTLAEIGEVSIHTGRPVAIAGACGTVVNTLFTPRTRPANLAVTAVA